MKNYNRCFYSAPKRMETESVVQNGLSVTPAQMYEMVQRGIPVSSQNLGLTYDPGASDLKDFEPPLEFRRGVDICSLWETQQEIKGRSKKAYSKLVSMDNQQIA